MAASTAMPVCWPRMAAASEGDLSDPPRVRGKTRQYNRNYAASRRPDRDFTDYQIADDAIAALEAFREHPFFLAVGFIRPHTPYVAPQAFFDRIDPRTITLPAFYQPGGENLADVPKAALRPNNNVFVFEAASVAHAREARRAYLASTAFVDAQVGRVLAKLTELGLDRNTIVLLTGDHGYQLGEHGLWAKQTLFEEGTRVPLIVSAPGIRPGVSKGLVEQVAARRAELLHAAGRERDGGGGLADDDVGGVALQVGAGGQVGHLAHRGAGAQARHLLAVAEDLDGDTRCDDPFQGCRDSAESPLVASADQIVAVHQQTPRVAKGGAFLLYHRPMLLCVDLDGVVYRGSDPVRGVGPLLTARVAGGARRPARCSRSRLRRRAAWRRGGQRDLLPGRDGARRVLRSRPRGRRDD